MEGVEGGNGMRERERGSPVEGNDNGNWPRLTAFLQQKLMRFVGMLFPFLTINLLCP